MTFQQHFEADLNLRLLQGFDEVLLDEGPLPLKTRLTRGCRLSTIPGLQVGEGGTPTSGRPRSRCWESAAPKGTIA